MAIRPCIKSCFDTIRWVPGSDTEPCAHETVAHCQETLTEPKSLCADVAKLLEPTTQSVEANMADEKYSNTATDVPGSDECLSPVADQAIVREQVFNHGDSKYPEEGSRSTHALATPVERTLGPMSDTHSDRIAHSDAISRDISHAGDDKLLASIQPPSGAQSVRSDEDRTDQDMHREQSSESSDVKISIDSDPPVTDASCSNTSVLEDTISDLVREARPIGQAEIANSDKPVSTAHSQLMDRCEVAEGSTEEETPQPVQAAVSSSASAEQGCRPEEPPEITDNSQQDCETSSKLPERTLKVTKTNFRQAKDIRAGRSQSPTSKASSRLRKLTNLLKRKRRD